MIKRAVMGALGYGCRNAAVRRALTALYTARHRDEPWMRPHPFDTAHGTVTSGNFPPWLLGLPSGATGRVNPYAACQPSCLRRALATIPRPQDHSFVDLGCGKGRALIVASALPFRRILGVDLAPDLVATARRNAAVLRRNHPSRTPIEIVEGDATTLPFPDGNLVIFLFDPFGRELIAGLASRLADAFAGTERTAFVVYENPLHGGLIDADANFTRWFCETVPCAPDEQGFSPDPDSTVVVWRIGGGAPEPARDDARAAIIVPPGTWRAQLAV